MDNLTAVYAFIFSLAVVKYVLITMKFRRSIHALEQLAKRAGLSLDPSLQGVKRAQAIHESVNTPQSRQMLQEAELLASRFMFHLRVVMGIGVVGLVLALFMV